VDASAVRCAIAPVLHALDDSILDYLAELIVDPCEGGPCRELQDLAPLLVSYGAAGADDEAEALSLCGILAARLRAAFPALPRSPLPAPLALGGETDVAGASLRSAPVSMRDVLAAEVHEFDEPSLLPGRSRRQGALFSGDLEGHRSVEEAVAGPERRRKQKQHDGVPLSMRIGRFADEHQGLRENGAERKAKKKHAIGMERPLLADAELKCQPSSASNAAAAYVPLQMIEVTSRGVSG